MKHICKNVIAWVLWGAAGLQGALAAVPVLAVPDTPAFSMALIAEDQGYFEAEGIPLKTIHCPTGVVCLKHLKDGDAQYAVVTDTPFILATLAGAPIEILASLGSSSQGTRLLARADRGVRSAADLKGRRMGFIKGTSAHYLVDSVLLHNGIHKRDVTMVELEPDTAVESLVRGEVDSVGLYSPLWQKAQAALGERLITLTNKSLFTVTVNLVGTKNSGADGQDNSMKILRALLRADDLIHREPERARAIVAARLNMKPADLTANWGDYRFQVSLSQSLITSLEAQTRWALRESLVANAKNPNYLDHINKAPLHAVAPKTINLFK